MSLFVSMGFPVPISQGGTGQITKAAGFDALSPMSATGDIILGGASGTGTALVIGTNKQVLQSNGTTASWVTYINNWRTVTTASASHIAGKVAGTYALTVGADPAAVSGTGTLKNQHLWHIDSGDFTSSNGGTVNFRLKTMLVVNDVTPTGNFTFGLYPVTHTGTTGGAGLNILTLGTVVASSTALYTGPAADNFTSVNSASFTLPADGFYTLGVITTGTIAASSLVWLYADLQVQNA